MNRGGGGEGVVKREAAGVAFRGDPGNSKAAARRPSAPLDKPQSKLRKDPRRWEASSWLPLRSGDVGPMVVVLVGERCSSEHRQECLCHLEALVVASCEAIGRIC